MGIYEHHPRQKLPKDLGITMALIPESLIEQNPGDFAWNRARTIESCEAYLRKHKPTALKDGDTMSTTRPTKKDHPGKSALDSLSDVSMNPKPKPGDFPSFTYKEPEHEHELRIFKYELDLYKVKNNRVEIEMPEVVSSVLCVGAQGTTGTTIHLWAEAYISPKGVERTRMRSRTFEVYGTGEVVPPDRGRYLGTVIFNAAGLVWHVYDGGNK